MNSIVQSQYYHSQSTNTVTVLPHVHSHSTILVKIQYCPGGYPAPQLLQSRSQHLVSHGVQVVEDDLLQVHLDLLHLPEDDSPLPLDLLLAEGGVGQDVREDLHGAVQVAGEALGVEYGLLPAGVGVEVSAHVLDLQLEVGLGPLGGSLEGHVLQEVGHAVVGRCLVPVGGRRE